MSSLMQAFCDSSDALKAAKESPGFQFTSRSTFGPARGNSQLQVVRVPFTSRLLLKARGARGRAGGDAVSMRAAALRVDWDVFGRGSGSCKVLS